MLNIYRASAGAGKTHHLTGEYLKLLFKKEQLPNSETRETLFNEILAVTFTNKSTAEMKDRIISELFKLSDNPSESHYIKLLREDGIGGTLTNDEIKRKARKYLTDILNNYNEFSISTIDSFFQKIVRSFARELNLQSNYEIELKSERIIETAISTFLDKLDEPDRKRLFRWMVQFSEKKLEDAAGWRIEKDLFNLANSVLNSEEYRQRKESLNKITTDENWLNNYTQKVKQIIPDTISKIKSLGQEGIAILQKEDFKTTDFFNGSKSKMKILDAWFNGEIKDIDDTIEGFANSDLKWYSKDTKKLSASGTAQLQAVFAQAVKLKKDGLFINYHSAKAIIENLYQLGILADIDKEVNEVCNEEGSMLLSNSTELLNKLISYDDAPFIYEKIGTRIFSFMIDEFQDTSKMQWNNFKPLIENSLAEDRENLIVGDVKQSIYRWRGSDWGLLHSELKKFCPESSHEDKETLNTNFRSQKQIVEFNNEFFKYVSETLSSENVFGDPNIKKIYSDVEQKVWSVKLQDHPGLVKVEFVNLQKEEKFLDNAIAKLPKAIMDLEDAGLNAKDIAILCRKGDECKAVADALLKFKSEGEYDPKYVFDIISNEALLLSSRHIIQTIISILRYLQNPQSKILKSIASCNYFQQCGLSEEESVSKNFTNSREIEMFLEFANRPLYDMLEGIISQLPNISEDIAFVQAFRDCILEFANNKKSDISAFLEWWDKNGEDKCINTPERQNAIQILTIHKSKGLGWPAVILPCIQGSTDYSPKFNDIIWCHPEKEPFAEENLYLPIRSSSSLKNTIFANDFQEERLRAIIDNLNTVYVAFTRAKEAMVIFTPTPKEDKKTKNDELQKLLQNFLSKQYGLSGETCTLGEYKRKKDYDKDEQVTAETISQDGMELSTARKIPQLSLKHDKMVKEKDAIERGNCIHDALSVIIDNTNVDSEIEKLYLSGNLDDTYLSCNEMKEEIKKLISLEEVKDWYKPGLKILNEKTILSRVKTQNGKKKEQHRPDRVVIDGDKAIVVDYKTGELLKEHYSQVHNYMVMLSQMGFQNVEGYIWYLNPHKVKKVRY